MQNNINYYNELKSMITIEYEGYIVETGWLTDLYLLKKKERNLYLLKKEKKWRKFFYIYF